MGLELASTTFALIEALWGLKAEAGWTGSRTDRSAALREELEHTATDLVEAQGQLREVQEEKAAALRKLTERQLLVDETKAALEAAKAEVEEMAKARQRAEEMAKA